MLCTGLIFPWLFVRGSDNCYFLLLICDDYNTWKCMLAIVFLTTIIHSSITSTIQPQQHCPGCDGLFLLGAKLPVFILFLVQGYWSINVNMSDTAFGNMSKSINPFFCFSSPHLEDLVIFLKLIKTYLYFNLNIQFGSWYVRLQRQKKEKWWFKSTLHIFVGNK